MNMSLRQERMRLLALAPETCLDEALSGISLPGYRIVRGPETGLVMARGRVGNVGDVFNVGEVLVTRCVVQLEEKTLGHAWIMGESPRHAELAALALSLCDNETTVWLAPGLDTEDVRAWFRFHCGTVLVAEPAQAAFAFVPGTEALPDLRCFHQGEAEYPDRSTTICLGGVEEGEKASITAFGPGIVGSCTFACRMPEDFLAQWQSNHEQFPLGVDMLLCGPGRLTGLPRTTCLTPAADEVSKCM